MKRIIMLTALAAVLALFPSVSAEAVEQTSIDITSMIDEQYVGSGADELEYALPDDVSEAMRCMGMDIRGMCAGEQPTLESLADAFSGLLDGAAAGPAASCAAAMALLMVISIAAALRDGKGDGVIDAASAAALCCAVVTPVAAHVARCAETLSSLCRFTGVFAPVYGALTLAEGEAVTSGYLTAVLGAATGFVTLAVDGWLLALLRVFLAVSCVSSVSETIRADELARLAESSAKWMLSLLAAVFLGLLAACCATARAADGAAARAAKLVVSGAVPIIGSAVGDAMGVIQSCAGALRASTGAFGLIAGGFILLPQLIGTVLWKLSVELCAAFAAMLGAKSAERLLRSTASALGLLLAVIVFIGVVVIGALGIAAGRG